VGGRGSELTIEALGDEFSYDVIKTLKILKEIDPALRRAAIAKMKAAARPVVEEARGLVPQDSGLSFWGNWTTTGTKKRVIGPYNAAVVRRGIKVTFKGPSRRDRDKEIFPLLKLQNMSAPGAIFDIAGRANGAGRGSEGGTRGRAMINKLRKEHGRSSRIVWEAAERKLPAVQRGVQDAIKDMEEAIQARVDRNS